MAGPIRISILADGSRARRELGQTGGAADRMGRAFKSAGKVAAFGIAGIAAGVTAFAAVSLKSVQRIERIGAQTDAVIKSTGGIADVTRAQIDELAGSLELLTATEAESITEGANMLLTFTNIRNESGKNNDVFNQSVQILTDMSRAFDNTGGVVLDTRKQAVQLGKALNDPIKGITALSKVGVSFSDQQKETIKKLVETGDTMGAQKVILAELSKEFGGAGEAFAKTTTGQIELAKHEIGTLGETIVGGLLPALGDLATKGTKGLQWATAFAESNIAPRVGELVDYVKANRVEAVEFAQTLGSRLIPILEDLGDLAVDVGENFVDLTKPLADGVIPALDLLVDVVGGVVGFLNDLPGPVKDFGIQAGIAAIILPRLTAAVTGVGGAMVVATTRTLGFAAALRATGTPAQAAALGRLGGAAKSAAGIGGLLALSKAASTADTKTATLLGTVGGAATGFSIAGPWGALIGGAAGAALGKFSSQAKKANAAAEEGKQKLLDYANSLDAVTGATTEATRATAQKNLLESGALKTLAGYGITARTAVNAALGQADASAKVQAALELEAEAIRKLNIEQGVLRSYPNPESDARREEILAEIAAREKAAKSVRDETIAVNESVKKKREEIAATRDYSGLLKGLPKAAKTEIRANGIQPTLQAVGDLASRYRGLDRKQIRTLIKAAGIEPTKKNIDQIAGQLRGLNKQRVELGGFKQSFTRSIGDFRRTADTGSRDIGRKLRDGTKNSKPDISGFLRALNGGVTQGKSAASAGSRGIGSNMKTGFSVGFSGASTFWSGEVSGAVRSAINAGKAAARVKSPSRETAYIGEMMGKGLIVGLDAKKGGAKKGGKNLIAAALSGIKDGSDGIDKSLDRLTRLIEKSTKDARGKTILKGLRDEFAQLRKNGKAQDRNLAKIEAARDRYKQLVSESKAYAASIKSSFVDYGSIIALGQGNGFANSSQLIDQLKARLENAKRFAALIKKLSGSLNATSLQQLIDAGVEGGLGTAEALVAGGATAISQINQLTAQIASAGGNLGNQMADKFKAAGIQAAAGLVAGLEREQKRLDKAAARIGAQIVKAIKKELGIKSPSRVFRRVGEDTMAGLALGLDETYAKRLGAAVGTGVETGFARPTLTADIGGTASAAGGSSQTIRFELRLSADQVDRLSRGKALIADIDYARSQGARSVTLK